MTTATLQGTGRASFNWPRWIVATLTCVAIFLPLFSGYGAGFKYRPLYAGFLGQDSLLVHDEAHLEPAFQELLTAIEDVQNPAILLQLRDLAGGHPSDIA